MTKVNLSKQHRAIYEQVVALSQAADQAAKDAGVDPTSVELVKIRVSQINGCAFCLRMHVRDAVALGETSDRLAVLAAWWESQYFSAEEREVLAVAEEVTRLTVSDHSPGTSLLTDEQVSAVSWLAITMNSWNRIAIRSGYPVAP